MQKYNILFFLFFNIFSIAFGQKNTIKFGEVEDKEVIATKHDKFPDAEAVVLYDYGSITYVLDNNPVQMYERVTRIKILKKNG